MKPEMMQRPPSPIAQGSALRRIGSISALQPGQRNAGGFWGKADRDAATQPRPRPDNSSGHPTSI